MNCVGQRNRGFRPCFIQLVQSGFNLRRLQRTGRFLFDPARGRHEPKDAAKLDEILIDQLAARLVDPLGLSRLRRLAPAGSVVDLLLPATVD